MATQKDVKNRIASIKNINKITRAMEMVAAARLRRAEQRIDQMRPYAQSMRKLTRRAAEQAGGVSRVPVLEEHADVVVSVHPSYVFLESRIFGDTRVHFFRYQPQ
jgi:ATP synthase F1 gamma subunit